jgi:hypothetical protein
VWTNLYTIITSSNLPRAWAWIIIFVSLILFICVGYLSSSVTGLFIPFQIPTVRKNPKNSVNPLHLCISYKVQGGSS